MQIQGVAISQIINLVCTGKAAPGFAGAAMFIGM
jgi:hypothetical protein